MSGENQFNGKAGLRWRTIGNLIAWVVGLFVIIGGSNYFTVTTVGNRLIRQNTENINDLITLMEDVRERLDELEESQ